MGDFPLDGSAAPIDLGLGFRLIAPGLVGQGRTHEPRQPGMRAGTPGQETAALDDALAANDMSHSCRRGRSASRRLSSTRVSSSTNSTRLTRPPR